MNSQQMAKHARKEANRRRGEEQRKTAQAKKALKGVKAACQGWKDPVGNLHGLSFPSSNSARMALSSYKAASSMGCPFSIFSDQKKEALILTPLVSTLVSSNSVESGIQVLEELASTFGILTTSPSLFPATPTAPPPSAADPAAPPPPLPTDPSTIEPEALVEMTANVNLEGCIDSPLTKGILSVKDATSILASLPNSPATSHYLGLRLVDALVSMTKFDNVNSAMFFRKRARWSVLEFCEESISAATKLLKIPYTTLVRIGRCIYGARLEAGMNKGEIVVRGGQKGQDVSREFSPGDNLIVQNLVQGEGVQPFICECRVEMAVPLILAPMVVDDDKKLLNLGGEVRVDRVASRIVYTRQLAAFSALTAFANDEYAESRARSLTPNQSGSNTPTNSNPYGPAGGDAGRISPIPQPMSNSKKEKLQKLKASGCNDLIVKVLTSSDPEEVVASAGAPFSISGPSSSTSAPNAAALANNPQLATIMENLRRANPSLAANMGQGGRRGPDRGANLNPSQKAAMEAAMSRRLTLVQGPPGTGKTSSSVAIVMSWIDSVKAASNGRGMGNDKIFCGSDSNIAVDNLLEGLIKKGVRAVRIGRPESASPHLLEYCVEEMASRAKQEAIRRNPNDKNGIANAGHMTKQRMVGQAEVICATCIGAAAGYLANFSFCHILVDEASQCHELSCLVPLIHGCEQLVLVGDHCQLPPTISCDAAKRDGLGVSLFDRLVQSGVPTFMLDTQYRMHPKIAEFASDAFYGGKVKNGVPESSRPTIRGITWPVQGSGVMLINTAHGQEASDGVSKSNQAEADLVSRLVADVLQAGELSYNDIGIISPYSAQVRLLRQKLSWARNGAREQSSNEMQMYNQQFGMGGFGYQQQRPNPPVPHNLEISSVDGFQGREKALIIFSAVRANHNGSVGFLQDWRRCNVAITRAQRGLVVLGHAETLQHDKRSFGPYLDYCLDNGFIDGVEAKPGSYDKAATQALAKNYDITANGNVAGLERSAMQDAVIPDGVMQAINPMSDVL